MSVWAESRRHAATEVLLLRTDDARSSRASRQFSGALGQTGGMFNQLPKYTEFTGFGASRVTRRPPCAAPVATAP